MSSIFHALHRLEKLACDRSIGGFERILVLCRDPRTPEEARWRGYALLETWLWGAGGIEDPAKRRRASADFDDGRN
jgi:hypothetical protein